MACEFQWRDHTSGVRVVRTPCQENTYFWYVISQCYRPSVKPSGCAIILSIRLSRASIDSKRFLHTMCASPLLYFLLTWRLGVVVSGVRRMNEVNARRALLVPGWVTVLSLIHI